MSFRLKTILGIALIEAVLLAILVVSSLHFLRASNEEELLKRAYTIARLFVTTTQDAVLATDLAGLDSAVNEVLTNPGVLYARVRDRSGRVLAEGGDPEAVARPFDADDSYEDIRDGAFDAYADVTVRGVHYGRVEVGLTTDTIEQVLGKARNRTVGIALAEMLLVAMFSFLLGLYLTRGLRNLQTASERIAAGDLDYQIEVHGRDELADAARAFNAMSQKLSEASAHRRDAQDALNKLNEDLERRVELRTKQLSEAYAKIEHQAAHDPLTTLPNRALFHDRLHQALLVGEREGRVFAVVILDLDRFKDVNDVLGHHSGDLVLQETALRLRAALRQSDTVARLGGDEFALILPTVHNRDSAISTVEKICEALAPPMHIDGHALRTGASLGVALYPQDGKEMTQLLRRADMAMYDAKRRKVNFALFTPELEQHNLDRQGLEDELRTALREGELVLHYQPKIDFATGKISGVAALIRWNHPRRGLMYPDDFLPTAEQSGLIVPLTDWVLGEALAQCKRWQERGIALPVSINVSPSNLQDPRFPQIVADALARSGAQPSLLELEITEISIMHEPPRVLEAITQLSALGAHIVIDNFGTGYSSMAYLRKLPVAKIKVDRSFVRAMLNSESDDTIVRTIIALGHILGLNVVAEGVENMETWRRLEALDCDAAQGYCMSRPIPLDELERWLNESPYANPDHKA